jgi:hypothetical protein
MHTAKQQGFGVSLVIASLMIAAAIGGTGWYVYRSRQNPAPTPDIATVTPVLRKAYTDTAGLYSLEYPGAWTAEQQLEEPDEHRPPYDWTVSSRPVELVIPEADGKMYVQVTALDSPEDTLELALANKVNDQSNTYVQKKIGDYDALYNRTDFTGPSGVEAYLNHRYSLFSNGKSIHLSFRERYRHDWFKTNSFDASAYFQRF